MSSSQTLHVAPPSFPAQVWDVGTPPPSTLALNPVGQCSVFSSFLSFLQPERISLPPTMLVTGSSALTPEEKNHLPKPIVGGRRQV